MKSNFRFCIVLFLTGASGMMLELTANRILAPWMGTSQVVWTSIIAVILGALSAGYYWGGIRTDKAATVKNAFSWLLIAAAWVIAGAFLGEPFIQKIAEQVKDLRISSFLGILLLYAVPSFFAAAVFPFTVKLSKQKDEGDGRLIGKLYAWSTLGSLFGTFLAGYWLIGILGHQALLLTSAAGLLLAAVLLLEKWNRASLIAIPIGLCFVPVKAKDAIADVDSTYNRIIIKEGFDKQSQQATVTMRIGNEQTSSKGKQFDLLMPDYNRFFMLADHFRPQAQNMLVIGGGGFCFPQSFLKKHPSTGIDVIELDPAVTGLAKSYFGLDERKFNIFHQDARPFLNQSQKSYDVIIGDAFKAVATIPFTLLSQEAFLNYKRLLRPGGVYMLNIVTAASGKKSELLASIYQTAKSVFPQVYLFPLSKEPEKLQNVVLVAINGDQVPSWTSPEQLSQIYLNQKMATAPTGGVLLTDDFAPVEHYAIQMLR